VTVDTLVWIAGLLSGTLLVYLVIALLLPEKLQ
jgi:K+-transporting ATPase KdpF subunit